MTTYRAYFLDTNKRICSSEDFEAASDDEALTIAKQWEDGFLIEVWQEGVFIGMFVPKK